MLIMTHLELIINLLGITRDCPYRQNIPPPPPFFLSTPFISNSLYKQRENFGRSQFYRFGSAVGRSFYGGSFTVHQ